MSSTWRATRISRWMQYYNNRGQCSAKTLDKWGQMTHTVERYGDIGNFPGVTYVILPFVNLKFVGTWAPTAKIIGDIPDFNVLNVVNVPKTQPQHNPGGRVFFFFFITMQHVVIYLKKMYSSISFIISSFQVWGDTPIFSRCRWHTVPPSSPRLEPFLSGMRRVSIVSGTPLSEMGPWINNRIP